MADWPARVRRLRYLWLLVPLLGLLELVTNVVLSRRAPGIEAWGALRSAALALKRSGEPVVVAPEWAEPLARLALGDRAFPLEELARADDRTVPGVLEIAELGARSPAARDWPVVTERREGPFVLRVLKNPRPLRSRYQFADHVRPGELSVALVRGDGERPCEFREHLPATAGGLHGQVAFPSERFQCPGGEQMFVGVTVIDDQDYRPRRCIWAHPPQAGALRLRFAAVPLGTRLHGYAGLSYFLFRDGVGPPITLSASSAGRSFGSVSHRDESGWSGFELATPGLSGQTADVDFEVHAEGGYRRDFCFAVEAVE
jgi:hypothetical protein